MTMPNERTYKINDLPENFSSWQDNHKIAYREGILREKLLKATKELAISGNLTPLLSARDTLNISTFVLSEWISASSIFAYKLKLAEQGKDYV